jgi:uncharacterized protein YidB (DUF937 family)
MDLLQLGAQMLNQTSGSQSNADSDTISSALSSLLGDGQGSIDLAGLASKMASSGDLGSVVSSWLGDGANSSISADDILGLLGEDQIASFSNQLGMGTESAASSLADVLPQLMDQASSGGSLLDAAGGIDGILGAAKKFLS